MFRKALLAAGALFALNVGAAHATVAIDAQGDFAPGFVGTDEDLDVLSFSANYVAATSSYLLHATLAGAINPLTGGQYVIGVNTGTGLNHPFGALGAPNVVFNQVMFVRKNGTGAIGANALTPTISGSSFSVSVPVAFMPSTGFAVGDYTFNIWPRNGANQIADFAPDNSMLSGVPEPKTWALMFSGFALLGGAVRMRRRSTAAFARPA